VPLDVCGTCFRSYLSELRDVQINAYTCVIQLKTLLSVSYLLMYVVNELGMICITCHPTGGNGRSYVPILTVPEMIVLKQFCFYRACTVAVQDYGKQACMSISHTALL